MSRSKMTPSWWAHVGSTHLCCLFPCLLLLRRDETSGGEDGAFLMLPNCPQSGAPSDPPPLCSLIDLSSAQIKDPPKDYLDGTHIP